MTNMVDAAGTSAYAYTAGNQLWTEDGPWASDTVTNTYNNRLRTGLVLQQATGSWTNGFGYDAAKRLSSVTSSAGTFTYTLGGVGAASPLPKKVLLPNTSYITNTYDTMARLTGAYLKTSGNVVTNKHEYGYNAGSQRINSTNLAGTYYTNSYDGIGQLKVADSSVNSEDRRYGYDAAWNLNYRTNNTTAYTFKVDPKNQLTNAFAASNTYDGNGNLVSGNNAHNLYVYDDENRLLQWFSYLFSSNSLSGGDLHTDFTYDGQGRLRQRLEYVYNSEAPAAWELSTETRYLYDGMRVIQERNASNVPQVSYTRGSDLSGSLEGAGGIGGLLGRSHAYQTGSGNFTNHNFYQADGNGNVTYMLNSSQSKVAEYRYDPFGNTISSSGSLSAANVIRFSSKEIHVNSGMYYYGYRFYDPNLQRWINRDPINEEGFDLFDYPRAARRSYYGHDFAFLKNSPIDLVDLFGLKVFSGQSCKGPEAKKMRDDFLDLCKQAKEKGCFDCPGKDAPGMDGPCDPKKYSDVVVECEDKSSPGCQTKPGGTGCGWTGKPDERYPGKKVVHVCMNNPKESGCPKPGCTLLHEVAHSSGGAGSDKNGKGAAYDLEKCVGCR